MENLIASGDCVSGNCFEGFGMIADYKKDQYYVGEFKNGEASGFGFFKTKKKGVVENSLSKWGGNKKDGLQLSFTKKNTIIFKANKYESYFDNEISGKVVNFDKRKVYQLSKITNQSSFYHKFVDSPSWNNWFTWKYDLENNKIKKNDYYNDKISEVLKDFDLVSYSGPNYIIGVVNIGENDKLFYIGETSLGKISGRGLWVSYINFEILDITYSNLDLLKSNTKLISKTADNEFISYSYKGNNFVANSNLGNITAPPKLLAKNIEFLDQNRNNLIEPDETSKINFTIHNQGLGPAYGITVNLTDNNNTDGLSFSTKKHISALKPDEYIDISLPIRSSIDIATTVAKFQIDITEANGFDLDKINLEVSTQEFIQPLIEISDYQFISQNGFIEKGETSLLQFIVQNVGQGVGEDIKLNLKIPSNTFGLSEKFITIDKLMPGEAKQFEFNFATNNRYSDPEMVIIGELSEKHKKYAKSSEMSIKMGQDVSSNIAFKPESKKEVAYVTIEKSLLGSSIDDNIPKNKKIDNRYALIIGNEDYASKQLTLSYEQNVDYAINDARVFKEYALNTLGVKDENMHFLINSTAGQMSQEIDLVNKIISKIGSDAELIVYYAGHGYPDQINKTPYLLPVDVTASNLSRAIKLDDFYSSFSSTGAGKIIIFLDACFTGGARNKSLLASRGIKVRPKTGVLKGNTVVFSASSSDQSSLPLHKEKHGIFTYHLLKKLQETKGEINLLNLSKYLKAEVSLQSLKINKADQEPSVSISNLVKNKWESWKF